MSGLLRTRPRANRSRVAVLVTVLVSLVLAACSSTPDVSPATPTTEVSGERRLIVTSTPLLADVVREIVGTTARVESVIEQGEDPRRAELSSRGLLLLDPARTTLLVAVGAGFEAFSADLDAASADGLARFDLVSEPEGESAGHDHGSIDPLIWTDPSAMAVAVQRLADRLSEIDPVFADPETSQRAELYVDRLLVLDSEIAAGLEGLTDTQRQLVTSERLLGRFADRYGLEILGTLREDGVVDHALVSDVEAARLVAEATGSKVFVSVLGDSPEIAGVIERTRADPVRLAVIDTAEPSGPAGTYLGLLETLLAELIQHLSGN